MSDTIESPKLSIEDLHPNDLAAFQIVAEACEATGLDIHPEVRGIRAPYFDIELCGEDAEPAFGTVGRHLDSFQFLMNFISSRKTECDLRLLLDAGGYRKRREEALIKLAKDCAAEVIERQEECELDPLPSHERRIIHNILTEIEGIRTFSEGEEPDRRIIIAPLTGA